MSYKILTRSQCYLLLPDDHYDDDKDDNDDDDEGDGDNKNKTPNKSSSRCHQVVGGCNKRSQAQGHLYHV